MADSPRKRSSRSPSPRRARSRSRSVSRSKSRSRSRGRSWSRSPVRSRSRSLPRSHGRNDAVNPGNTLYVTGLSTRVTERDLEDHFSKEGKVVHCRLVVEPRTRMSRGFGFVTMDNVENADRCIKYLNQSVLEGRYITVEKSRRKRPRTPTPGNYLGVKSTRESSRRHDRVKYRGGYGHDDYGGGFRRGAGITLHVVLLIGQQGIGPDLGQFLILLMVAQIEWVMVVVLMCILGKVVHSVFLNSHLWGQIAMVVLSLWRTYILISLCSSV